MSHSGLLQETVSAMQDADFEVYFNEGLRRYFDVIGVGESRLFVKVLNNIDNIGSTEATELRKFAQVFASQSFVVGERAGMEPLRDDVIYHRFENPCANIYTFRKILRGESVSRFTKRGQFLIGIDGIALSDLRKKCSLSQEDLARILGCTGQTVYRIENQNRITEELYEKLIDYFGKSIEISPVQVTGLPGKEELPISDPLKKEILREYFRLKLDSTPFSNPVDFVLEENRTDPILTPVSRTEAELRAKQRTAKNLEDVLGCSIVHITKEERQRRLPSISFRELRMISSKREMLERVD